MPTTDNPNDPRLTRGINESPVPQSEIYLVLSEAERAKGFVRPLRAAYRHVGKAAPRYPLLELSDEQKEAYPEYVKYEKYPETESPKVGKYWTQAELDKIGAGCNQVTLISPEIAETYARSPHFYGATYCTTCQKHLPIDEFVWTADGERLGS